MKKTNFQFYATHDEIMYFINEVISANNVHVYLVRVCPEYAVLEVKNNHQYELSQWTFALFSDCKRELNTDKEYSAYTKTTHGDLIMYIGDETESELKESSIGVVADHLIKSIWIKSIGLLKKRCMQGAYLVTPQNIRKYYPNIKYSEGAQAAYRNGKTIRPIVGWNHVELISK